MTSNTTNVKPKGKPPGPQGRWMNRARLELGVSLGHLWQVEKGIRKSRVLSERLAAWKAANNI